MSERMIKKKLGGREKKVDKKRDKMREILIK